MSPLAAGRFELRGVNGRPTATLLALPGPFAARLVDLDAIEACSELELEVRLAVGGALRGRVVDQAGIAVPNADLRAVLRARPAGTRAPGEGRPTRSGR